MTIDIARLLAGLGAYAWVFLRVTGFLLTAPVFGASTVSVRIKVVLAVALTWLLAPLVGHAYEPALMSAGALLTALNQLLIGVAIGFSVQVVFAAMVLAGEAIALSMGLGFATLVNPEHAGDTPVVGQLYQIMGVLLYLALDGHIVLLGALADSFRWLPPGSGGVDRDGLLSLALLGGRVFAAGAVIALPAVVALLIVNLALGVISRAAPQLNLFSIGFPASMLFGFLVLLQSLPAVRGTFERLLVQGFGTAARLAGAH